MQRKEVGKRVAVIGAGGIGFDVCEYLSHSNMSVEASLNKEKFFKIWGIDKEYNNRGALTTPSPEDSIRKIYLLQRKSSKFGKNLGKSTGWIHRLSLKNKKINFINSVEYQKIDDSGLHIKVDGKNKILEVDSVVICAGQTSNDDLYKKASKALAKPCYLIGGAERAVEIDAKRAIDQGVRLGNQI